MAVVIGRPYLRQEPGRTLLCSMVELGSGPQEVWFAVEDRFAEYLAVERIDAFVAALLPHAMRLGADIESEGPITRRLHYQLNQYLAKCLSDNMEVYNAIKVGAPVATDVLPCEHAVGTGWTGGVDCTYTLMTHRGLANSAFDLTHLVVANNGALESKDNEAMLKTMVENARNTAGREFGLDVVGISSNIQEVLDENYLAVAGYRLPACILALQKLFGVFLHSGAYEFQTFALDETNSAYYELLLLQMLETDCTVFYSSGTAVSRIQKIAELGSMPFARKNLHPCIHQGGPNCGTCGKCVRTIMALYALDMLDDFSEAFDVERFNRERNWYLEEALSQRGRQHYDEVIDMMVERGMEVPPEVMRAVRIKRAATMVAQRNFRHEDFEGK